MSIQERSGSVRVNVYVQPRASKSEVVGPHGDAFKIRLAAPPVEGEANEELIRFLAKLLRTAASNVSIVSGASNRRKVVEISDVTVEQVQKALAGAA